MAPPAFPYSIEASRSFEIWNKGWARHSRNTLEPLITWQACFRVREKAPFLMFFLCIALFFRYTLSLTLSLSFPQQPACPDCWCCASSPWGADQSGGGMQSSDCHTNQGTQFDSLFIILEKSVIRGKRKNQHLVFSFIGWLRLQGVRGGGLHHISSRMTSETYADTSATFHVSLSLYTLQVALSPVL